MTYARLRTPSDPRSGPYSHGHAIHSMMCWIFRRSHASKRGGSSGLDTLDGLMAYLRPRVPMTDHVDYRARSLVIGSGIMESTCKQLVGQRLKGSSRQWSEGGALAMTALIGQRINRSWDAFRTSRPIHRAA